MNYLLSNKPFENSKKYGNIFYAGGCCRIIDNVLSIAVKSSELNKFDDDLSAIEFNGKEIGDYDDFFVKCMYDSDVNILKIQTDIIGYESSFLYFYDEFFVLSDSLIDIISVLKDKNIKVSMSLEDVRDQLCWGANFGEKTIVNRIIRLGHCKVYTLDCQNFLLNSKEYNDLVTSKKVMSPKNAAENIYRIIDRKFKDNPNKEKTFGIGLSGGLDSRVAAYFAVRHNYKIKPFFLGSKYGKLGILSYDARRSIDVQKALKLPEITFINKDRLKWHERVENDLENAPSITSNAHICVGYDFLNFDNLLNGAMGGELFGHFIAPGISKMADEELADYLMSYICFIPKCYPRNFISKVFDLPNEPVELAVRDELISKEGWFERKQKVLNWISEKKRKGFSNIKILQLDLYMRYGRNHSVGYFASLHRQKNSFPVYLWPSIIKEMLSWDDALFLNKQVQKELLLMLGSRLSRIGGQAPIPAVTSKNNFLNKALPRFEYWIRGSGMRYIGGVNETDFAELEAISKGQSGSLYDLIKIKNPSWKLSPLLRTSMLKFSLFAQKHQIEIL